MAIKSVLHQNYKDFSLIIVDDHSTIENFKALETFIRKLNDKRILLIRNKINKGLQHNLFEAVQIAKSPFIARIDDDDLWLNNDKLTIQLKEMNSNPSLALCGTNYFTEYKQLHNYPITNQAIRNQILLRCPFCHSSVLFRKSAYDLAGGYDTSIKYGSDWDLWLRIGMIGDLLNINKPMVQYTQEGETMTAKNFKVQHVRNWEIVSPYLNSYPNGIKAQLYHRIVSVYFKLFYHERLHKIAQYLFKSSFGT